MSSRKVTSIARRINRTMSARVFWCFMLLNVFLLLIAVGTWSWQQEMIAFGSFDQSAHRSFVFESFDTGARVRQSLASARYEVYGGGSTGAETLSVDAGPYLVLLFDLYPMILAFEGVVLFFCGLLGSRRAKHILQPLDEMAENTIRLAKTTGVDNQKVRHLQTQISAVDPDSPNARLATGDKELEGLEKAVNGLIARMREMRKRH